MRTSIRGEGGGGAVKKWNGPTNLEVSHVSKVTHHCAGFEKVKLFGCFVLFEVCPPAK